MFRVKICGLTRRADAEAALELGADALGFNLEPTSPRYLGDPAPEWIEEVGPTDGKVAVFGRVRPVAMGAFDYVQGVIWETDDIPADRQIRVLRLRPDSTVADVAEIGSGYAALLLDAYREEGYGGTGHRVDWNLAADIGRGLDIPIILAGGLTPGNVAEAIATVRPYAVDVSSGVESSPGVKDLHKMRDFIHAARGY